MVLVNGANGIGTGFSTTVPSYNPIDIIDNVCRLLDESDPVAMSPWSRGFKGVITKTGTSWITHGAYSVVDNDTVVVTELPIGRWTQDYKEFLENNMIDADSKSKKKAIFASYENHSTEAKVKFLVRFPAGKLQKLLGNPAQLESDLHLTSTIGTSNMHLYSPAGAVKKYPSDIDILREYFSVRLRLYEERRQHMLGVLRHDLTVLQNKARFVSEIMDDQLMVYRKSKQVVEELLQARKFLKMTTSDGEVANYNYLVNMQISSFTNERIDTLEKQSIVKQMEIDFLEETNKTEMWKKDLDVFRDKYIRYRDQFVEAEEESSLILKKKDRKRKKAS